MDGKIIDCQASEEGLGKPSGSSWAKVSRHGSPGSTRNRCAVVYVPCVVMVGKSSWQAWPCCCHSGGFQSTTSGTLMSLMGNIQVWAACLRNLLLSSGSSWTRVQVYHLPSYDRQLWHVQFWKSNLLSLLFQLTLCALICGAGLRLWCSCFHFASWLLIELCQLGCKGEQKCGDREEGAAPSCLLFFYQLHYSNCALPWQALSMSPKLSLKITVRQCPLPWNLGPSSGRSIPQPLRYHINLVGTSPRGLRCGTLGPFL